VREILFAVIIILSAGISLFAMAHLKRGEVAGKNNKSHTHK